MELNNLFLPRKFKICPKHCLPNIVLPLTLCTSQWVQVLLCCSRALCSVSSPPSKIQHWCRNRGSRGSCRLVATTFDSLSLSARLMPPLLFWVSLQRRPVALTKEERNVSVGVGGFRALAGTQCVSQSESRLFSVQAFDELSSVCFLSLHRHSAQTGKHTYNYFIAIGLQIEISGP